LWTSKLDFSFSSNKWDWLEERTHIKNWTSLNRQYKRGQFIVQ
jgi:hypothetical protein